MNPEGWHRQLAESKARAGSVAQSEVNDLLLERNILTERLGRVTRKLKDAERRLNEVCTKH